MSFDQDPNEEVSMSGADFAQMVAEIDRLKAELTEAKESVAEAQQCYEFLDHQNNDLRNELAEAMQAGDAARALRIMNNAINEYWGYQAEKQILRDWKGIRDGYPCSDDI